MQQALSEPEWQGACHEGKQCVAARKEVYGLTAGSKDPLHLVSSALNVLDVFEHRTGDHHVGFGIRKRKPTRDICDVCRVGSRVLRQLGR